MQRTEEASIRYAHHQRMQNNIRKHVEANNNVRNTHSETNCLTETTQFIKAAKSNDHQREANTEPTKQLTYTQQTATISSSYHMQVAVYAYRSNKCSHSTITNHVEKINKSARRRTRSAQKHDTFICHALRRTNSSTPYNNSHEDENIETDKSTQIWHYQQYNRYIEYGINYATQIESSHFIQTYKHKACANYHRRLLLQTISQRYVNHRSCQQRRYSQQFTTREKSFTDASLPIPFLPKRNTHPSSS